MTFADGPRRHQHCRGRLCRRRAAFLPDLTASPLRLQMGIAAPTRGPYFPPINVQDTWKPGIDLDGTPTSTPRTNPVSRPRTSAYKHPDLFNFLQTWRLRPINKLSQTVPAWRGRCHTPCRPGRLPPRPGGSEWWLSFRRSPAPRIPACRTTGQTQTRQPPQSCA